MKKDEEKGSHHCSKVRAAIILNLAENLWSEPMASIFHCRCCFYASLSISVCFSGFSRYRLRLWRECGKFSLYRWERSFSEAIWKHFFSPHHSNEGREAKTTLFWNIMFSHRINHQIDTHTREHTSIAVKLWITFVPQRQENLLERKTFRTQINFLFSLSSYRHKHRKTIYS